MSCSSSIQCWDLNPQPLEHESFPITTRPGLPPLIFVFSRTKLLEVSTSPFQTKRNMFLSNSAVIDFLECLVKVIKNLFLQRNFIKTTQLEKYSVSFTDSFLTTNVLIAPNEKITGIQTGVF